MSPYSSSLLEKENAVHNFHKIKKKYIFNLFFFEVCKKRYLLKEDFDAVINNSRKIIGFYNGGHIHLRPDNDQPLLKEISKFLKTFKNKDLIELLS